MPSKVAIKSFSSLILSIVLLSSLVTKVFGQGGEVVDPNAPKEIIDNAYSVNPDGTVDGVNIPTTVITTPKDEDAVNTPLYNWVEIPNNLVTLTEETEWYWDAQTRLAQAGNAEAMLSLSKWADYKMETEGKDVTSVNNLPVNSTGYITVNGQDVGGYVGIKYKYDSKGVVVGTQKIFIPYDTNQVNPANLPDGWDDHIGEGPPPRPPCPSKVTPTSNQIISYDSTAPIPFSWIYGWWGGVLGVAGGSSVDQSGGGDGLPVSAYVRV